MRILVIGGEGFIGASLLPLLATPDDDVILLRRRGRDGRTAPNTRAIAGDRQSLNIIQDRLRAERPDVVVDLILSSGRQATALREIFDGFAGRIVAVTSMDVYRATSILHGLEGAPGEVEPTPLTEDSRLRTISQTYPPAQLAVLKPVFGWLDDEYDKVAVERALRGHTSLPVTILRLPMIYGPGDRLSRFWPYVKRIQDGRRQIIIPASLAQWRAPRGYVGNVAAAIALATRDTRATNRTYNVAEPVSYTEGEWVTLIASRMNWWGEIVAMPDALVPAHLRQPANYRQNWDADSSRIRRELGYREPVDLMTGIDRTIEATIAHPPELPIGQFDYAAEDRALSSRGT